MHRLTVNGRRQSVEADDDTPLLWVLREELHWRGVKYGCGVGLCGACTVHLDGQSMRSCQIALSDVGDQKITTIEGLADTAPKDAEGLHPVQAAWIAEQVPQCGYCQSGMIMAAAALLRETPRPDKEMIEATITNICRCGTYPRIVRAIQRAAGMKA